MHGLTYGKTGFVPTMVLALAVLIGGLNGTVGHAAEWYRGNIHMHSYWSDGVAFPEEAAQLYRESGYQFLCISDHNRLADDTERWAEVGKGKLTPALVERMEKRFPENVLEKKEENGKTFVRLRTFDEFAASLNDPGQFLLIPGYEHTLASSAPDNRQVHINVVGTQRTIPVKPEATVAETLAGNVAALDTMLVESGEARDAMVMLNHPNWRYFDVTPEDTAPVTALRFFELCNCAPTSPAHEKSWTNDKFWDVVTATRLEHGEPVVWGVATDDTHNYDYGHANPGQAGAGWVVVRAEELSQEAIVGAMKRGDFYNSTGVELADITWDAANRTLSVRVKPIGDEKYTIEFIGTRRGTDLGGEQIEDLEDGNKPGRTFTLYSDAVGETWKRVENIAATCQLPDDGLYIRARIVSDAKPDFRPGGKPEYKTAWTQPYFVLTK